MPGIDPSIPLRAGAGIQPLNPLQTLTQAAQMRYMNANANQLTQAINANRAMSGILQKNTDANGNINYPGVVRDASQNPDAAYNLPQLVQSINAQKQQNVTLATSKQALASKRWEAFGKAAANFMTNPDATGADYVNELTNLAAQGIVDAPTALQELKRVSPYLNDPAKLKQMVQQSLAGLPPEVQEKYILPAMSIANTGRVTNVLATTPATGATHIVGTIQNSMTPGEAATPVPYFDTKTGTPAITTKGRFAAGSAAGTSPTLNGGLPTGPALGQPELASFGAKRRDATLEAAGNAPTAINGYNRALDALNALSGDLGTGGTGPGADRSHLVTGALNALGVPLAPNDTTNYQTLKKYLANAATQAASSAGYSGSDARMDAFEHGQPNASTMNPEALRGAIKYVKALQQGVIAKNNAMQAWMNTHGGNTATLQSFETQWSNAFTPDVMEYRDMSPEQMQTYKNGLSPKALENFKKSYLQMAALGAF